LAIVNRSQRFDLDIDCATCPGYLQCFVRYIFDFDAKGRPLPSDIASLKFREENRFAREFCGRGLSYKNMGKIDAIRLLPWPCRRVFAFRRFDEGYCLQEV